MKEEMNLNKMRLELWTHGGISEKSRIRVYFDGIEEALIDAIDRYDYVVGCAAWLTNENILSALSGKEGVSIIVQKEDLYRKDGALKSQSIARRRRMYERLPSTLTREHDFLFTVLGKGTEKGVAPSPIEAVRCVGMFNTGGMASFPRMHHKFLVFCEKEEFNVDDLPGVTNEELTLEVLQRKDVHISGGLVPKAVWTGSFNFSYAATLSLENGLFIEDDSLASYYFDEYCQVMLMSEPLDWSTHSISPQYKDERENGVAPIHCRKCGELLLQQTFRNDSYGYPSHSDDAFVGEPYCENCRFTLSGCRVLVCERCSCLFSDETPDSWDSNTEFDGGNLCELCEYAIMHEDDE